MRALQRPTLPQTAAAWLVSRQAEVDATVDPDTTAIWKYHRQEMNRNGVCRSLREMVGDRERCVYCGDSVATDVDHYRPKKRFPSGMFVWLNLLWTCGPCNRKKAQTFPLSPDGIPLLIDPTVVDPWDHLFFVFETGELTARVDPVSGVADPLGEATTDPKITRLNAQAITKARVRAWRALRREVRHFLADPQPCAEADLFEAFDDTERPDVAIWILAREGADEDPFSRLKQQHPVLVARILAHVASAKPG